MSEVQALLKKIRRHAVWGALLMVLAIIVIALLPLPLGARIPLAVVAVFVMLIFTSSHCDKLAQSPLMVKLDPMQYHYVMYESGYANRKDKSTDILTAQNTGNYALAVALCREQLALQKNETQKALVRIRLAHVCFEMGDLDSLREICEEFERLFQDPKRGKFFKRGYGSVVSYFQSFLSGDFAACKKLKEVADTLPARARTRYLEVRMLYYYALACHKNGEREEAERAFREVAVTCPMMHISKLSYDFLQGEDPVQASPDLKTQIAPPSFPVMPSTAPYRHRGLKITAFVLSVAVLILIFCFVNRKYDTPLLALGDVHEVIESYHEIPIGEQGDVLCVYLAQDEDIVVSYVGCYGEQAYKEVEWLYLYLYEEDVDRYSYCIRSADADLVVEWRVAASREGVPDDKTAYPLEYEGVTYYLYLSSVTQETVFFDGYSVGYPE
ncbi:MAG: hypothetical protein E7624_08785 [Ruminococcaceae bacterium]|nr:hypothetical protein [Oscillospiraceae bacterium]